jgi:hypothetical protein
MPPNRPEEPSSLKRAKMVHEFLNGRPPGLNFDNAVLLTGTTRIKKRGKATRKMKTHQGLIRI